MSLLRENAGAGETAATGRPRGIPVPADPVPADPVPADPVPDEPVSGVRRTRRTGPRPPEPPAPRPTKDERTDGHPARRLLVNVIMFPVMAVVGLGLFLSPLLMVAAGVALLIWPTSPFDATRGTLVIESCHYGKATIGGERKTFSECTGRFVAEDGSLVVERAAFERSGTIEVGDRVSARISESWGADNAMGDGEFYFVVFFTVSMWLGGAFLIPGGFWLGYQMIVPKK